jgi:hypothetical protein
MAKWTVKGQTNAANPRVITQEAVDKASAMEIGALFVSEGMEFVTAWPSGERGWHKRVTFPGKGGR